MTFSLKKIVFATSLVACAGSVAAAAPTTQLEKESYSLGASYGHHIASLVAKQKELGQATDVATLVRGLQDALAGKSEMKSDDILKTLNARAEKLNKLKQEADKKIAEKNLVDGKVFLAQNAKKKGVVTTKSGLQYEAITKGTGAQPKTEDIVSVEYTGKLIDGTVFDSTKGKEPARFVLMTIIPGLEEGIKLMNEGSEYRFTIPSNLAYNDFGTAAIPPESVLIFDVKLLKVEKVQGHQKMGGMGGMGGMGSMNKPH